MLLACPPSLLRVLSAPALALACASTSLAQVELTGSLSDNTTGPLVSGTVYHATGALSVPSGATLTIPQDVIIKFPFNGGLTVDGTLNVNGPMTDSIIFTDIRDDNAGGDTNGDGAATTPARAFWRGVQFNDGSDASFVQGLTVRFAGRSISAYELRSCDASFQICRAQQSGLHAFNLNTSSLPTLTSCSAEDCTQEAFTNVRIEGVPLLAGLSATGNGFDRVRVSNGTVPAAANLTIGTGDMIQNTIYLASNVVIPASSKLTVGPGSILKFAFNTSVLVDGEIELDGAPGNVIILTDERDDAAGGDTNGDAGATSPTPAFWRGIRLGPATDSTLLEWFEIRYAGRTISPLELNATSPQIRNCLVRDGGTHGVDLNANSRPVLQNVTIERCAGQAIQSAEIQALAQFSGLAFADNAFDRIRIEVANLTAGESILLRRSETVDDVLYFAASVVVPDGAALTVEPGMICKMAFNRVWDIDGLLDLTGMPGRPIVITDERDDSVGGDTNSDGTITMPAAAYWRGLAFGDTSDGSTVAFTEVRYAGRAQAGIEINDAILTLNRCVVSDSGGDGIDFNNSPEPCVVERVRIFDAQGAAINQVRLERLQDIEFAEGSGNGLNTIRVTQGTLNENTTIEPNNQFNGSILCIANIVVPSGIALNLQPGVVIKLAFDRSIRVSGSLSVRGSLDNPVVITEQRDDSVGGDTNGDGAVTSPTPSYWRGITFDSTTDASIVLGLELRYGGRSTAQVVGSSSLVALREVRSRFSGSAGFRMASHAVALERVIASECQGSGIELSGGSFDLRQVSCVGNGGFGLDALASFTGDLTDSILWNNGSGPERGLGAGRIAFSNAGGAFAGSDGNVDVDPLFVDEASGDLHLTSLSPVIDAGDLASPLDPDSTRADMGALFFNTCAPDLVCEQVGAFPPCNPGLSWNGFASLSSPQSFELVLSDAPTNSFAIFFYGIGAPTTVNGAFGLICVGGPYERTMPVASGGNPADGPCAGTFVFDFQAYAQSGMDPAIVAGVDVIGHFWYRYSAAPGNALFSDGIRIPICP
ncbi:MAG: hypothetical protein AAGG01_00070 [Planctomycetota bacterium]